LSNYIHEKKIKVSCKYIGVSHLCCPICSFFLDSYSFNFRGISKKIEEWKLPSNADNEFTIFIENIKKFKNKENVLPFKIDFKKKKETDCCKLTAGSMISNEYCHIMKFYLRYKFESYNFILDDLNKDNTFLNIFLTKFKSLFNCIDCNNLS